MIMHNRFLRRVLIELTCFLPECTEQWLLDRLYPDDSWWSHRIDD